MQHAHHSSHFFGVSEKRQKIKVFISKERLFLSIELIEPIYECCSLHLKTMQVLLRRYDLIMIKARKSQNFF